ncbi:MAG: hypothetical protein AAF889_00095 [Cyanobacteria bacterium P01_D01_bin.73]
MNFLNKIDAFLIFSGIALTVITSVLEPYIKESSASKVASAISTGLFLSGVGIKITRVDLQVSSMKKQIDNDMGHVISKINRHSVSKKPQYLQTTSKVFGDYTYKYITDSAMAIVNHITDETQIMQIDNLTPAYLLMSEIVKDLGYGYAYIATSKLSSYGSIPNIEFRKFSNELERKAKDSTILASRLYYREREFDAGENDEIKRASLNNFLVRHNTHNVNGFNFDDSNDIAFILAPSKWKRIDVVRIRESLSKSELDPIQYLVEAENYTILCALKFHLRSMRLEPLSNVKVKEVRRIEILSSRNWPQFGQYKDEFSRNWRAAVS